MYDIIVVGAGPAGLTSALYASRRMLKTLVIGKNVGGQAAVAKKVENYPGIDSITGMDLTIKMKEQAERFGVEFKFDEVVEVKKDGNHFVIKSETDEFQSKTVVLAFGLTPRNLDVPGEKEFLGKGISYCATCDAPFFKDKTVVVVGGGNSALDGAFCLAKIAKKVYLIHRRDSFRAEAELACQIDRTENLEVVLNSVVKEIVGKDKVEKIIVKDVNDENKTKEIETDGVFVEVGLMPKTGWVKDFVKTDERNQIITNKKCETSIPGAFSAGDVTDAQYKQIVIAAGEGATAALRAHQYILKTEGKSIAEAVPFDWGRCQ